MSNKIREELGIESREFNMAYEDYQILIEKTECDNYEEFKDLCDEVNAQYLPFDTFKRLLNKDR